MVHYRCLFTFLGYILLIHQFIYVSCICRLLRHFLLLTASAQMSYSLFRCMAALSRDHIVANTVGCLALMGLLLFGGFIISRGNYNSLTLKDFLKPVIFNHEMNFNMIIYIWKFNLMLFSMFHSENAPNWLVWGFWLSPLTYAQTALSTNEFLGKAWKQVSILFFFSPFFFFNRKLHLPQSIWVLQE